MQSLFISLFFRKCLSQTRGPCIAGLVVAIRNTKRLVITQYEVGASCYAQALLKQEKFTETHQQLLHSLMCHTEALHRTIYSEQIKWPIKRIPAQMDTICI